MSADERGVALIITLMAMLLLSAIGAALVLTTSTDVLIAANAGAANSAFYAADAAFERALAELRVVPDFTSVLAGVAVSAFVDGPSRGPRMLADGSRVDLAEVVNHATCQKATPCSETEMNASIRDRPWGTRNPRWRLFSWGPLSATPTAVDDAPPVYVIVMVADDPGETDGDPTRDGAPTGQAVNPGAGVLWVRSEGYGARGAHRVIEGRIVRQDLVALARWAAADPAVRGPAPTDFPVLRVLSWREVR